MIIILLSGLYPPAFVLSPGQMGADASMAPNGVVLISPDSNDTDNTRGLQLLTSRPPLTDQNESLDVYPPKKWIKPPPLLTASIIE